jgi:hypothetical protein
MSIGFVRVANTGDSSRTVVSFAENNAGDTLFAIFAITATTADIDNPATETPTLTDSEGRVWTLAYSSVNNANNSGSFNGVAVYALQRCAASGSVDLDGSAVFGPPGDALQGWAGGFEVTSTFANFAFGDAHFQTGQIANFTLDYGAVANTDVLIGVAIDSNDGVQPVIALNVPPLVANGFGTLAGDGGTGDFLSQLFGVLSAPSYSDMSATVTVPATGDVFAFGLVLSGANNTGGSAATTLTFSIAKGPVPEPPHEGRVIATVQIDCTQQPVVSTVNFPELAVLGDISTPDEVAFVVAEFDLEHLFQGSGLSKIHSITCYSRPGFQLNPSDGNRTDVNEGEARTYYPALLTNTTTLQCVILGANAAAAIDAANGSQFFGEHMVHPFPANKSGMKYRFICPQYDSNAPVGKFLLQFYNWELPAGFVSPAGLITTTED